MTMKKHFLKISLLFVLLNLLSCEVAQQLAGTYNMTQCKYEYRSISNLSLAGINLQNVSSLASLNPLTAANLLSAFSSSSGNLPLQFTLNIDVTNPGLQTALLNGLNYILEIDGIQMTNGSLDSKLQIASGQKVQLPVNFAFDLKKTMSGQSLTAIKNLAFNFAGIGDASSDVTIKLQPTLSVGGSTYSSPVYIPVSFTLNKK
jgi:LEA14-like dessication related protein